MSAASDSVRASAWLAQGVFAALSIATIPLLIIYIILQRQFSESLAGFAEG